MQTSVSALPPLENVPPEEYEQSYYARLIGPSTDDAADKTAA